jgi:hypothetical protein
MEEKVTWPRVYRKRGEMQEFSSTFPLFFLYCRACHNSTHNRDSQSILLIDPSLSMREQDQEKHTPSRNESLIWYRSITSSHVLSFV